MATPKKPNARFEWQTGDVEPVPERTLTAAAAPNQEDPMTTAPAEAPEVAESDGDEPTSVVVVALPAASDPCQGIGDEQKHATILFFGDTDENDLLTGDFQTALAGLVQAAAAAGAPFTAAVTGVESLGDDDARVWMLDGADLPGIRDALLADAAVQAAWQAVEQYPSFTPHVTIGYPADTDETPEGAPEAPETPVTEEVLDAETEAAAAAVQSITFDRLAIWWAGEQTEYPLGSASVTAGLLMIPQDIAVRAAASVGADGDAFEAALLAAMAEPIQAADAPVTDPTLPEAQPTPAGTPALAQDIPADGEPFYGIMCPEGVTSGDARQFGIESLTWRDLPLPLMYQDAQLPGHDGAVRVGRIDSIERDATTYSKPMIRYSGVWDTSPIAQEAMRQVGAGVARGVSVDGDDVTTRLLDSAGNELDPMNDEVPADGVIIEHADAARACGATICSVPAFQQAYIANGTLADRTEPEPGQGEVETQDTPLPNDVPTPPDTVAAADPVMASAWTIGLVAAASAPPVWVLPAAHFANPGLSEATPLTVTPEGRVYGHLAVWGTCHIGQAGKCMEPPKSRSGYAYFNKGITHTDDGNTIYTGPLTMKTGHASLRASASEAVAHYDNTGTQVADVVMGQDTVGIWFSGHLRDDLSPQDVHAIAASGSVSGDWREIVPRSRDLELVSALVVNTPGFPMARPQVTQAAGGPVALVASGAVQRETPPAAYSRELVADLTRQVMASMHRQQRAQAAVARVRTHRIRHVAARLTERSA